MLTRPLQLSEPGDPGYEQPFEMLHACHERVHRMLALLARLREHVDAHGADDQARQAARDVMRYFDLAAPQHHLDEERHVLPRLESSGDPALVRLAERLRHDHQAMEEAWPRARALLEGLAQGRLAGFEADAHAALAGFAALYRGHIESEESAAFPGAQPRMDATALRRMAEDMMRRRGVG